MAWAFAYDLESVPFIAVQRALNRRASILAFTLALLLGLALALGIIAGRLGFLSIAIYASALILWGFLLWVVPRWRRARWLRSIQREGMDLDVQVEVGEDGLQVTGFLGASILPWSSFQGVIEVDSGVFMPMLQPGSKKDGIWIPCDETCRAFIQERAG